MGENEEWLDLEFDVARERPVGTGGRWVKEGIEVRQRSVGV